MDLAALWLVISLLLTHELDAVRRHEWRILPLTSFLPDKTAGQLFIWAHVPLILVVLAIVQAGPASLGALLFSGFAIAHVSLHWLYRNHPRNEFLDFPSQALIVLAGLAGALHLGLVFAG